MITDKQARKEQPIARGCLDYFPDALAAVANVSYVGGQQHHPGQPMHWDRSKSTDQADCIARHLIERGTIDTDGLRHSAKVAWRALAMLQEEIETNRKGWSANPKAPQWPIIGWQGQLMASINSITEKATPVVNEVEFYRPNNNPEYYEYNRMIALGCPPKVASQIVKGITHHAGYNVASYGESYVYIAGPMRGIEKFNFPAFDGVRSQFRFLGYNVISPADVDRASYANADDPSKVDTSDQTVYAFRDFWALYYLAKINRGNDNRRDGSGLNGVVLLPGWTKSTGAVGEFFLARWLGLKFFYADGREAKVENLVHDFALAPATMKPKLARSKYDGDWDRPGPSDLRGVGWFYRVVGDTLTGIRYDDGGSFSFTSLTLADAKRNIDSGEWTRKD